MESETDKLREQITDLLQQWKLQDAILSELRKQLLLETREKEQEQLQKKWEEAQVKRQDIGKELDVLELEFQQASEREQTKIADSPRKIQSGRDYFEHIGSSALIVAGDTIIYQQGGPLDPDQQVALQTAYLRRLLTLTSRLDLTGIDRKAMGGHEKDACLDLGMVYTALLTHSSESDLLSRATRSEGSESDGETLRRLSAIDVLNKAPRLVLLGDSVSGKSTFVKFVTLCMAGELLKHEQVNLTLLTTPLPDGKDNNGERRQSWEHGALLPVLVLLRDFAASGLPPAGQPATAKHLWDFLVRELKDSQLGDYAPVLQQHLWKDGGLLLLDGLDEVPEAAWRRTQIKQVVEDFAAIFPQCHIVVTSRTYAYQQQDLRFSQFTEAVLAPFTERQIRIFVDRWYTHVAAMRGMDAENAQGKAELLKRAIFSSPQLLEFAERPLLLTLMAILHAWRGGSLPEKRGELYAEATDLLLNWWDQAKVVQNANGEVIMVQESLTELLKVGKERVQQILSTLAFEAHSSQPDLVGTADIPETHLLRELLALSKDVKQGRLIEFISDRAGLLVARGNGIYTFPHRTFQEYLAAMYLTGAQDYPDNIADLVRADPNRWREVTLLAAASAANVAPMIWLLVDALCYLNPTDMEVTVEDAWGGLLAGQALSETTDLKLIHPRNQQKIERVRQWLLVILTEQFPEDVSFLTTDRALAGNILAQLGDSRPGVGLRDDGLPDISWCDVPTGEFTMGSEEYKNESPVHSVLLSAYVFSRYPVTNAQYQAFLNDQENISVVKAYGGEFDLPNHPVIGNSWHDAVTFCQWLTARLRETGDLSDLEEIRLPTEAEWEKAARGTDAHRYPWGNDDISPELANYNYTNLGSTSTVGCFPRGRSPYGCEDMSGNIWEWCLDWYDEDYYKNSPKENPSGPGSGSFRVMRGGAWNNSAEFCRSACRNYAPPDIHTNGVGFRLVRAPM